MPAANPEEKIWVKSARTDGRLALWERNAAHPNGEILITSPKNAVLAARTATVQDALVRRLIVEDPEAGKRAEAAAKAAQEDLAKLQTEADKQAALAAAKIQLAADAQAESEKAATLNAAQAEVTATKAELEQAEEAAKQAEESLKTTEQAQDEKPAAKRK